MLTSLLCSAVEKNDTDAIKSLIERGANLDFPSSKMNRSALHLACLNGNVEIVELLCENNVDIEALDSQGSSPLILACSSSNPTSLSCVKYLLERGSLTNVRDFTGNQAHHIAAGSGCVDKLCLLTARDPSETESPGWGLLTPLHFAAEGGYLECIELLLRKGANPNVLDACGMTPLHWAARQNHGSACSILLRFGADPLAEDYRGHTASDLASIFSHFYLMNVLKENEKSLGSNRVSNQSKLLNTLSPDPVTTIQNVKRNTNEKAQNYGEINSTIPSSYNANTTILNAPIKKLPNNNNINATLNVLKDKTILHSPPVPCLSIDDDQEKLLDRRWPLCMRRVSLCLCIASFLFRLGISIGFIAFEVPRQNEFNSKSILGWNGLTSAADSILVVVFCLGFAASIFSTLTFTSSLWMRIILRIVKKYSFLTKFVYFTNASSIDDENERREWLFGSLSISRHCLTRIRLAHNQMLPESQDAFTESVMKSSKDSQTHATTIFHDSGSDDEAKFVRYPRLTKITEMVAWSLLFSLSLILTPVLFFCQALFICAASLCELLFLFFIETYLSYSISLYVTPACAPPSHNITIPTRLYALASLSHPNEIFFCGASSCNEGPDRAFSNRDFDREGHNDLPLKIKQESKKNDHQFEGTNVGIVLATMNNKNRSKKNESMTSSSPPVQINIVNASQNNNNLSNGDISFHPTMNISYEGNNSLIGKKKVTPAISFAYGDDRPNENSGGRANERSNQKVVLNTMLNAVSAECERASTLISSAYKNKVKNQNNTLLTGFTKVNKFGYANQTELSSTAFDFDTVSNIKGPRLLSQVEWGGMGEAADCANDSVIRGIRGVMRMFADIQEERNSDNADDLNSSTIMKNRKPSDECDDITSYSRNKNKSSSGFKSKFSSTLSSLKMNAFSTFRRNNNNSISKGKLKHNNAFNGETNAAAAIVQGSSKLCRLLEWLATNGINNPSSASKFLKSHSSRIVTRASWEMARRPSNFSTRRDIFPVHSVHSSPRSWLANPPPPASESFEVYLTKPALTTSRLLSDSSPSSELKSVFQWFVLRLRCIKASAVHNQKVAMYNEKITAYQKSCSESKSQFIKNRQMDIISQNDFGLTSDDRIANVVKIASHSTSTTSEKKQLLNSTPSIVLGDLFNSLSSPNKQPSRSGKQGNTFSKGALIASTSENLFSTPAVHQLQPKLGNLKPNLNTSNSISSIKEAINSRFSYSNSSISSSAIPVNIMSSHDVFAVNTSNSLSTLAMHTASIASIKPFPSSATLKNTPLKTDSAIKSNITSASNFFAIAPSSPREPIPPPLVSPDLSRLCNLSLQSPVSSLSAIWWSSSSRPLSAPLDWMLTVALPSMQFAEGPRPTSVAGGSCELAFRVWLREFAKLTLYFDTCAIKDLLAKGQLPSSVWPTVDLDGGMEVIPESLLSVVGSRAAKLTMGGGNEDESRQRSSKFTAMKNPFAEDERGVAFRNSPIRAPPAGLGQHNNNTVKNGKYHDDEDDDDGVDPNTLHLGGVSPAKVMLAPSFTTSLESCKLKSSTSLLVSYPSSPLLILAPHVLQSSNQQQQAVSDNVLVHNSTSLKPFLTSELSSELLVKHDALGAISMPTALMNHGALAENCAKWSDVELESSYKLNRDMRCSRIVNLQEGFMSDLELLELVDNPAGNYLMSSQKETTTARSRSQNEKVSYTPSASTVCESFVETKYKTTHNLNVELSAVSNNQKMNKEDIIERAACNLSYSSNPNNDKSSICSSRCAHPSAPEAMRKKTHKYDHSTVTLNKTQVLDKNQASFPILWWASQFWLSYVSFLSFARLTFISLPPIILGIWMLSHIESQDRSSSSSIEIRVPFGVSFLFTGLFDFGVNVWHLYWVKSKWNWAEGLNGWD